MNDFRADVDESSLIEIDLQGGKFTWEKSRGSSGWVKERLDRAFASRSWLHLFPLSKLSIIRTPVSDHDLILLDLYSVAFTRKEFRFRFENTWLQEANFHKETTEYWLSLDPSHIISKLVSVSTSTRRKTNHIPFLENDRGSQVNDNDGMCSIVRDYFLDVFRNGQSNSSYYGTKEDSCITNAYNQMLVADLTFQEFTTAVKQMHPDKSSGPIGLNPAFFQQFWHVLGNEVFMGCRDWLRNSSFPANLNDTNVLANRLKRILPHIITENQAAFMPGRSINDNVMIAFEVIHHMKKSVRGSEGDAALKLDISKAYDRVKWMMLCVQTVSYEFCFNGVKFGPIIQRRGIRQGDPLSPYLFLFYVEGLSLSLSRAVSANSIHGVKVSNSAPVISHLLFVDDSFLFFRASNHEAVVIKSLLDEYASHSGQSINYQKSRIFFSSNVKQDKQSEISSILGVSNDLQHSMYLGLPSLVGRSKKRVFGFIKDRLWKRLQGWRAKKISRAGKTVLIKNVATAAKLGVGSSFIWQGIVTSKNEIMHGYRWVLGDGEIIKCCQDPWLIAKADFRVIQTHSYVDRNIRVADLFVPGSKDWDISIVGSTFSANDAALILSTRIPGVPGADHLAWSRTKNGVYSVKTGYQCWHGRNIGVKSVPQSDGWSRNNIHVRSRLSSKGVNLLVSCPICNSGVEDLLHIFFHCPFAMACWQVVDAAYDLPLELINKLSTGPGEEILKIAKVLWGIWFFHNKRVWDNKVVPAGLAIAWSTKGITDWKEARDKCAMQGVTRPHNTSQSSTKWSKPNLGVFKLNVDAAVKLGTRSFSIGSYRDLYARITLSRSMVTTFVEAESLAILEGLQWLDSINYDNVVIESDSLLAVQAIKSSSDNLLEVGFILDACRTIFDSRPGYSISFVKRQANRVAPLVAKLPCNLHCQNVLTSPSGLLLEALMVDISQ
ncbi:uncharacterized protein LOC141665806 [Apium graveolens]|uniref:uncharacterized protein LOC141665806 n=1 Tax=Apium graveolens TaxID=4045 RepID=UPI003D79AEFA